MNQLLRLPLLKYTHTHTQRIYIYIYIDISIYIYYIYYIILYYMCVIYINKDKSTFSSVST